MPLSIKHLIEFIHGILHTRYYCLYYILAMIHILSHFIVAYKFSRVSQKERDIYFYVTCFILIKNIYLCIYGFMIKNKDTKEVLWSVLKKIYVCKALNIVYRLSKKISAIYVAFHLEKKMNKSIWIIDLMFRSRLTYLWEWQSKMH